MTFEYQRLFDFAEGVFRAMGCPAEDARQATETLLSADLRGVDSHGVARLSGYVRLWEAQRINAAPRVATVHETPSTAVVDGDAGLGLVVAPHAMRLAIEKAQVAGTGWVAVRNSNHFGIAGYHAMLALPHDMIGIALTNASPLVAPTYSLERLLGTNPISVAIPAGEQPPFVLDMATTTAAQGKMEILERKGLPAPAGWIQDKEGQPSSNPTETRNGGALVPLGGETGSHKGYGLGATVDILSAVLSGANYGPWVPPFVAFLQPPADPVGQGIGHFFGVMRVDAFRPAAEFKAHMDKWIETFRQAKAVPGQQVLIPGDPERRMTEERLTHGIPLLQKVVDDLQSVGQKFGVTL
ncbi:Ldh family oxidoreductase [Hymenobacter sp. 15J16-1T3B]|uniref:Ldh family oxidoreductase n=1 Tax=Hymenobacter sp. 15J16-1T3B TaxID=2886941 RepID=UPI001D0F873D|nr:Ldh family oxidoreductase [Hymenobacter sp. 15J16-1T3B]MCC3157699.1 Ldh family oxidoreductase [Hymenobacter sp. 15J16-1T3B]